MWLIEGESTVQYSTVRQTHYSTVKYDTVCIVGDFKEIMSDKISMRLHEKSISMQWKLFLRRLSQRKVQGHQSKTSSKMTVVSWFPVSLDQMIKMKKPEPEFLNICWRLKSPLFKKSCLFKGQRVQQGSNREHLFVLMKKILVL